MLGKLFGSREHAPVNIAGLAIVLGMLGLILISYWPAPGNAQGDLTKSLAGLIIAAFTFLGGYLGGGKK